eukprot:1450085-Lingulodinium_polyedra.AAC.1
MLPAAEQSPLSCGQAVVLQDTSARCHVVRPVQVRPRRLYESAQSECPVVQRARGNHGHHKAQHLRDPFWRVPLSKGVVASDQDDGESACCVPLCVPGRPDRVFGAAVVGAPPQSRATAPWLPPRVAFPGPHHQVARRGAEVAGVAPGVGAPDPSRPRSRV